MVKWCVQALALIGVTAYTVADASVDTYPAWRSSAAQVLASRPDAGALATAAALTFLGPPSRPKAESAKAAAAALDLAVQASQLAPDSAPISWLRLQLCTYANSCNVRDAATTMRWIAPDNGAAWLPTLATAQRDRDSIEVDRILASMAESKDFALYTNHTTVLMFDALKRVRSRLPSGYLTSDLARLTEATGIADASILPSFSPLINACREATPASERREDCLTLSKTMQRADTVMAQLVGFAIAKRLAPSDARELRTIAERRRLLEWRVATADQADEPLPPWLRNAHARAHVAKMRKMPREEDVCIALLRDYDMPLEPPEEHR